MRSRVQPEQRADVRIVNFPFRVGLGPTRIEADSSEISKLGEGGFGKGRFACTLTLAVL